MNGSFPVDRYQILFGIPNELQDPIVHQLNYVILLAKYHIYKCNMGKKNLSMKECILECRNNLLIEHNIHTEESERKKFHKKWMPILLVLAPELIIYAA